MIAQNLIRNDIKPLSAKENVQFAIELMDEFKVQHLPVVDKGVYIGVVSEDYLLDAETENLNFAPDNNGLVRRFLFAEKHLFDAIALFGESNLSMLPILDEAEKYIGYIYPKDIVVEMGSMLSSKIPGGILVLEVNQNDYHLSQIAQIVESNDAKILACYLTSHSESTQLEVTLRINRSDLTPIIQTFQRYDYTVSASFHTSFQTADLKDRYDSFMKYLNM